MGFRIFVVPASALFTDHRPHGDGLVGFGFVSELAARGHELHVAAGDVDLRRELPANVHLHRLGGGDSAGRLGRIRFMGRLRRLYGRLARSARFDLVHQLTPVEVGVSLALAGVRAPLVLGPYVPDWPPSGEGGRVVGPAGMRLKGTVRAAQQAGATTVLLSTPAAASKLAGRAARGAHVHELPLGVDARAWVPGDGRGPGGQRVLFLASLEVRKGIHVLLDAFARVAARLPEARLTMAGAGSELEAVRRRIDGSRELGRVELLGRLGRERAIEAMQGCAVYCLPSYGEPWGLAAVEAMACARPVVATSAGGLGHLVPGEGGRTVSPGDAGALAAALLELLGDPDLRSAMGEHNRRVVEERYAWSRVVDRLEAVYGEAVEDPAPALARRWYS